MGCGCKDIEQDKAIIDYYNNKKRMEEQTMPALHIITWEGSLCDAQLYIPDESLIIRIEKVNDAWQATLTGDMQASLSVI